MKKTIVRIQFTRMSHSFLIKIPHRKPHVQNNLRSSVTSIPITVHCKTHIHTIEPWWIMTGNNQAIIGEFPSLARFGNARLSTPSVRQFCTFSWCNAFSHAGVLYGLWVFVLLHRRTLQIAVIIMKITGTLCESLFKTVDFFLRVFCRVRFLRSI